MSARWKRAPRFSSKLDQLSIQYPQEYERICGGMNQQLTLTAINHFLKESSLGKVRSIERGCSLLLTHLKKKNPLTSRTNQSRQYERGLGNLALLPNEIIVKIFEYVLAGLDREGKILPYQTLSKAISLIVQSAHKNLKRLSTSTLYGFPTTCQLTPYCENKHLDNSYQMVFITI